MSGCGGGSGVDATPPTPPVFPEDYSTTYQEVRDCRFSLDHDLQYIRVLASPDALEAYTGRTLPFPIGSILLKEQYSDSDTTCSGEILDFTVMQKLAVGAAPADLDWTWQKVKQSDFTVEDEDIKRCTSCHKDCGQPPVGYDGTCTMP